MNVYIYLRKTEDWLSVKVEECTQADYSPPGTQRYLPVIHEWNKEFSIPWTIFRNELYEKAIKTWSLPVLRTIDEVLEKDDIDGIIPIDDDDWLHPDIGRFVQNEMRDSDLLQWSQIINVYDEGYRFITRWGYSEWCRNLVFSTSDHCLRVRHLRTLKRNELYETLNGHGMVRKTFFDCVKRIVPKTMSCYNRHIGSHSILYDIETLDEVRQRANTVKNIPQWAMWAESGIHWLDRLTSATVFENRVFL